MQLRYVFSETGTGLRRNVSMTIALVVTIFVSLTLVGMGLLVQKQSDIAEDYWGSKLQITVFLCNQNLIKANPRCASGEVTPEQRAAIVDVLKSHPEVRSYQLETKAQAFEKWKRIYVKDRANAEAYSAVRVDDMQDSYRVTLKDPQKFEGVKSALAGMDGVSTVSDLREVLKPIYFWMSVMKWGAIGIAGFLVLAAILQVANTIRLAAYARRREIGIMRLVGASTLYIQLPFLLEMLVAAIIGVGLAMGSISLFMWLAVDRQLRVRSKITEWVSWGDAAHVGLLIGIFGVLMTAIPTLLMTRKYLKV